MSYFHRIYYSEESIECKIIRIENSMAALCNSKTAFYLQKD